MEIILMTMLLFSGCLASESRIKYFSKGLKVFSELIATDLEENDFLEIMNYIGSRFHHQCHDVNYTKQRSGEAIQTLLETTVRHENEMQKLSAKVSETEEEIQAMAKQYNQFKQAVCDSESFKSCLSGDCCIEQTLTFQNLALEKPAWQSSVYHSDKGEASAAVDGNRNTDMKSGRSCFHTNQEDHPWWMVDLGAEKHIGRVVMVNRGDDSYARLRNVVVSVSLERDGDSVTCGTFEGPGAKGQVITITCPEEIRGRFVKLTMNSRNYFHLCEVEVYRN